MDVTEIIGEVVSLTIVAIALGLDAFSVALGIGLVPMRLRRVVKISLTVGIFNVIMPLIGMIIGYFLSVKIGNMATIIGGFLLIGMGFYMFFSAFGEKADKEVTVVGIGLILFAISVSIDSVSVGLSLGMLQAKAWIALLIFGSVSGLLTCAGLILGRYMQNKVGLYGELVAGGILVAIGLKLIFPLWS